MHENYMVCNCKQVSYFDILSAVENLKNINDVVSAFKEVQQVTHCSTGCGGCHDKVLKVISDALYGYDSSPDPTCAK